MRVRRAAVALVVLALPAAAWAQRAEDRDDSAGAVDISLVRASHNRVTDELVFVVGFHAPVRPALLRNSDGPPGSVCVNVWTTRTPGESAPNYDVCVTSDRRARGLQASISRHGTSGGVRRAGAAEAEFRGETEIVLRFDPDRIRRPDSFRWTVQAVAFSEGCPSTTGCEDFVPDRPEFEETRLRTPRSRG